MVHDGRAVYLGQVKENGGLQWCKKPLKPMDGVLPSHSFPQGSTVLGRSTSDTPNWEYLITSLPQNYSFGKNGHIELDAAAMVLIREAAAAQRQDK